MAMRPQLWMMAGIVTETGMSSRRVGDVLKGVEPDGRVGSRDAWFMTTFNKHAFKSDEAKAKILDLNAERAPGQGGGRQARARERGRAQGPPAGRGRRRWR
jgi:hypothetical protein